MRTFVCDAHASLSLGPARRNEFFLQAVYCTVLIFNLKVRGVSTGALDTSAIDPERKRNVVDGLVDTTQGLVGDAHELTGNLKCGVALMDGESCE